MFSRYTVLVFHDPLIAVISKYLSTQVLVSIPRQSATVKFLKAAGSSPVGLFSEPRTAQQPLQVISAPRTAITLESSLTAHSLRYYILQKNGWHLQNHGQRHKRSN